MLTPGLRATCPGSRQAVLLDQAFQGTGRVRAPKAPPHPLTRAVNWVRSSGVSKSDSETKTRGSVSPERWGESESLWSFGIHSHPLGRCVSGAPFPKSRPLPYTLSGCRPPKLGPWPLSAFPGSRGPQLRAAAGRRERSPRCPRAPQVQALSGNRPRPPLAPCAGSQSPRAWTHPGPARLPAGPHRRAGCWRPPALLFPFPSLRVPPPASRLQRAGRRPRCSRTVRPPALQLPSGAVLRVQGGSKAGRPGWMRRWGAGGARGGEEGMKEPCSGRSPAGSSGKRSGDCGPAEAPAALLDSLNRGILRYPALPPGTQPSEQAAHL